MRTRYVKIDPLNPEEDRLVFAAEVLRRGGLVAFPTETVYGLGANAFNSKAVEKIFEAKGRPQDNPLIVHICNMKDLERLARYIPEKSRKLMENFFPGPLTIILPKKSKVPDQVTAGLKTVAVRMPDHPVALKMISLAGVPVAAPSANLSGKPSPTTGIHALKDLAGRIDLVLDGGKSRVGIESTVVDCTEEVPVVLRPGGITVEEMERVVGKVLLDPFMSEENIRPKSPGMKYTHYAPAGEVYLVRGRDAKRTAAKMDELSKGHLTAGSKVAVIAFNDTLSFLKGKPYQIYSLGSRGDLALSASRIFGLLRECDRLKMDYIFVEGCTPQGIGLALMNRLQKASGGRIVEA